MSNRLELIDENNSLSAEAVYLNKQGEYVKAKECLVKVGHNLQELIDFHMEDPRGSHLLALQHIFTRRRIMNLVERFEIQIQGGIQ